MILQHVHSALDPASPDAASVGRLYNYFLAVSVVVWILVVAAALWAARRRSGAESLTSPDRESRARRAIGAALVVTIAVLFVTLVYDLAIGRTQSIRPVTGSPLVVRLIGHQWWWEVHYEDSVPQNRVVTANEMHVPVNRPIIVKLESRDVIHSFWVPNLAGKKDLIPGKNNEMWFTASRPGVYRSPCAEFCGLQHAKMALYVVAERASDFDRWLVAQRGAAQPPAPSDTLSTRGRVVFETGSCVMCHRINGTTAGGTVGPDLTHVASRLSLAAGTLPNTRGHLGGWIVDPQRIKPGVLMPSNGLEPADLQALLSYMGTLR